MTLRTGKKLFPFHCGEWYIFICTCFNLDALRSVKFAYGSTDGSTASVPTAASDAFASAGTGSQCTSTHESTPGYGYVIRIDWNAVTVSTPGESVTWSHSKNESQEKKKVALLLDMDPSEGKLRAQMEGAR